MNTRTFNHVAPATFVAFLFYALAGAAMAADPSAASSKLNNLEFSSVDANHDGYIDSKEAATVPELGKIFKNADKDHDGKLSMSEFLSAVQGSGADTGTGGSN